MVKNMMDLLMSQFSLSPASLYMYSCVRTLYQSMQQDPISSLSPQPASIHHPTRMRSAPSSWDLMRSQRRPPPLPLRPNGTMPALIPVLPPHPFLSPHRPTHLKSLAPLTRKPFPPLPLPLPTHVPHPKRIIPHRTPSPSHLPNLMTPRPSPLPPLPCTTPTIDPLPLVIICERQLAPFPLHIADTDEDDGEGDEGDCGGGDDAVALGWGPGGPGGVRVNEGEVGAGVGGGEWCRCWCGWGGG